MNDPSSRPAPGPLTLPMRAVFVPDGEEPPPDLACMLHPLRLRASLDPATGAMTCDDAGMTFHGDIAAIWIPDGADAPAGEADASGTDSSLTSTAPPDPDTITA